MAKLSINLVAYNGAKYLSTCFSSVLAQDFRNFSLMIIDNGSTDGTREKIREWESKFKEEGIDVKIIYLDKNVGFAEGHNIGMWNLPPLAPPYKGGDIKNPPDPLCQRGELFESPPLSRFEKGENVEYICCLNQDIILKPDFFGKIIEFMDLHPECGSASGKLMRAGDEMFENLPPFTPPYKGGGSEKIPMAPFEKGGTKIPPPTPPCEGGAIIDSAGLRMFKSHRVIEIGQGEEDKGQYAEICEVFGVSGAVPVYRAEALVDVVISRKSKVKSKKLEITPPQPSPQRGGSEYSEYFDSDFFSYKEDIDIAYRLRWRGWKSFVIPQAVAYHKRGGGQRSKKTGDFTAVLNRKNKSKFLNYHSQRNQMWMLIKNLDKLTFSVFFYEFRKFGYELLFEWHTFKAWFDIFKKLDIMKKKRKWIMGSRKITAKDMEKWFE